MQRNGTLIPELRIAIADAQELLKLPASGASQGASELHASVRERLIKARHALADLQEDALAGRCETIAPARRLTFQKSSGPRRRARRHTGLPYQGDPTMTAPRPSSTALGPWLGTAASFAVAAAFGWGVATSTALAPQPAQAVASLSGSTGATAAAIVTRSTPVTTILKWPSGYTFGSNAPAGTPCSNIDLLPGEPVTMQIQVLGSARRCWPVASTTTTCTAAATNLNPIVVTQATLNGNAQGVQVTTVPTAILKWQELWSTAQPTPAAGTACSPIDMLPGEVTMRHVQVWMAGSLWSRCVDNTLPAYAN